MGAADDSVAQILVEFVAKSKSSNAVSERAGFLYPCRASLYIKFLDPQLPSSFGLSAACFPLLAYSVFGSSRCVALPGDVPVKQGWQAPDLLGRFLDVADWFSIIPTNGINAICARFGIVCFRPLTPFEPSTMDGACWGIFSMVDNSLSYYLKSTGSFAVW
jgi:hypothetical protein